MILNPSPVRYFPMIVGVLLGLVQTSLFFQLTFTLTSGFTTYLLVTVCWLLGSMVGVVGLAKGRLSTNSFLLVALVAGAICAVVLRARPFEIGLWPVYAALVAVNGVYPGVFFARMASLYRVRTLFFMENNGFIMGLALGTLAFMLAGRIVLWIAPLLVAVPVYYLTQRVESSMRICGYFCGNQG